MVSVLGGYCSHNPNIPVILRGILRENHYLRGHIKGESFYSNGRTQREKAFVEAFKKVARGFSLALHDPEGSHYEIQLK
jgi:hypothetical protein